MEWLLFRPRESWRISRHQPPARPSPATATSLRTHSAYELSFPEKMAQRQVLLGRSLPLSAGGLSGCVLPLHHQRHCTHVGFSAVLGMDVLQHCVSGQRSWVSRVSVKISNGLCVRTGNTYERRTSLASADAIHGRSVQNVFRCPM
jgi:hypothetical protein